MARQKPEKTGRNFQIFCLRSAAPQYQGDGLADGDWSKNNCACSTLVRIVSLWLLAIRRAVVPEQEGRTRSWRGPRRLD
jgi:hypothetical protein